MVWPISNISANITNLIYTIRGKSRTINQGVVLDPAINFKRHEGENLTEDQQKEKALYDYLRGKGMDAEGNIGIEKAVECLPDLKKIETPALMGADDIIEQKMKDAEQHASGKAEEDLTKKLKTKEGRQEAKAGIDNSMKELPEEVQKKIKDEGWYKALTETAIIAKDIKDGAGAPADLAVGILNFMKENSSNPDDFEAFIVAAKIIGAFMKALPIAAEFGAVQMAKIYAQNPEQLAEVQKIWGEAKQEVTKQEVAKARSGDWRAITDPGALNNERT